MKTILFSLLKYTAITKNNLKTYSQSPAFFFPIIVLLKKAGSQLLPASIDK